MSGYANGADAESAGFPMLEKPFTQAQLNLLDEVTMCPRH